MRKYERNRAAACKHNSSTGICVRVMTNLETGQIKHLQLWHFHLLPSYAIYRTVKLN